MTDKKTRKLLDEAAEAYKNGNPEIRQAIIKATQRAGQKWLPDAKFKEQFETGKKHALEEMNDDGEVGMYFCLYGVPGDNSPKGTEDVAVLAVMADWQPESDKEKFNTMQVLGKKFYEDNPNHMLTTVVQIAEAWMVQRNKEQPEEDNHIAPSQSPNKKEIVFVEATSLDQRHSMYSAEIIRDKNGDFKELQEYLVDEYDPNDPKPQDIENMLAAGIFMGNARAKFPKEFSNDATTK